MLMHFKLNVIQFKCTGSTLKQIKYALNVVHEVLKVHFKCIFKKYT